MTKSHLTVAITKLPHARELNLPRYATEHSAGLDLEAAIDTPIILKPGERTLTPTGIAIALPEGYEAQIRPRSGLSAKNGVTVLNSPGTIDADYRGEIKVILINLGAEPFTIECGMRIAQMVVAPYTRILCNAVDKLDETERGSSGFGSTGIKKAS
ncbi:MAG: dUTP diphosphatase [Alphaproteobacteria bacterium]|nr:dUTP diphosphatase [Alphaproteobacteria bacterium]MCK5659363.1 dUTP diphosphatase [Alphaproteobacteria bacterium]